MVTVKIDRSTLRRNPNAGKTSTWIETAPPSTDVVVRRGGVTYILEPAGAMGFDDGRIVGQFLCRGMTAGGDAAVLDAPREWKIEPAEVTSVETQANVMEVEHFPAPKWLFDYLPTPVTCIACGETFDVAELKSDYGFSGPDGDEVWSDSICPRCGEWDCCEVHYETPREAGAV